MGFEVDNCCGCIKLRTGSLIIGYLYLFVHVCTIIISCIGIGVGNYIEKEANNEDQDLGTVILIIFSILLIAELWSFLVTVLLLVGVHKNNRSLMKPYLVFNAGILILYAIIVIVKIACGHAEPFLLTFEFCDIVLGVYYYIVIRSHYRRMEVDDLKIPAIYSAH